MSSTVGHPSSGAQESREQPVLPGYGQFKIDLSGVLTSTIILNLATVFDYPPALVDEIRKDEDGALLLIKSMEEKGQITQTNISTLLAALNKIGRRGTADKVKGWFDESIATAKVSITDLKEQIASLEKTLNNVRQEKKLQEEELQRTAKERDESLKEAASAREERDRLKKELLVLRAVIESNKHQEVEHFKCKNKAEVAAVTRVMSQFGKKGGSSKGGSRDSKSKHPTGGSQVSTYSTRGSHDSKPYYSTGIGTRSRPPPQSEPLFEEMRNAVQVLSHVLEKMPTDMRLFSLALRSLYTDSTAVGKTAETKQFLQLRNSTTEDARFYTREILPKCSGLIAAIKEVFQAYSAVDFVEWKQDIADTIKEVDEHVLLCEQLASLHGEIEGSLQSRKQEADKMLLAMAKLPDSYTKQVNKMRDSADKDTRWWAYSLSFIPAVSTEATALLSKSPHSVMTTALSKVAPGKLNNAACVVIRDTLMPALISFIQGVEEIKFFFNALGKDLELRKHDVAKQRLHYELMKKEAKQIIGYCQYFFAVIPGIETDLAAIPDATTDANSRFDWTPAAREHSLGAADKKYVFRLDVVNGATKESHEVDVAEGQNLYQTLTAYQRKNKQFRMKCTGDDSDHIVHTIGYTSVDHKTSRRWSVYYGDAYGQAVERASDVLECIMPQPYEVIILQYQDVQKGRSRTKESKGEGSWLTGRWFSSQ